MQRSTDALQKSPSFSPFQAQIDASVSHFVENATDWKSITAMMAGSLAYRWGKIGILSFGNRARQAAPLRILAPIVGLAAEVPTFEITHRTLQTLHPSPVTRHLSPHLWSWSGQGGLKEGLLSSFVTFATLKSFGRFTQGQNVLVQHGSQDLAMVLGHQLLHQTGLAEKPEGSWGEQFLHAEETNLQLGLGMQLVHSLAPGLHALERGLDFSSRPLKEGRIQDSPLQKMNVPRRWGSLLEKNSLLSLGPMAGLEEILRQVHQDIGTTPLILTGLGITVLAIGKILYSRRQSALRQREESLPSSEASLTTQDLSKKDDSPDSLKSHLPPPSPSKGEFGILSLPKVRSRFLMSLADIILFQDTEQVIPRVRKVEEGLSHPESYIREYLLETLGEIIPQLASSDRLERVKKIEASLNDPHLGVRLQALKSLAWSLQFIPSEERDSRFLKIEGAWSDPNQAIREIAVDLLLDNITYLPIEQRTKWIALMEGHLKSPHLFVRTGAFEILERLETSNPFFHP